MTKLLAVCLGGALGSGARYLLSVVALRALGASFPWGTLAVNVLGSFALVVLASGSLRESALSPALRLFLGAGLCGGFTTYSTFNLESMRMLEQGRLGVFGAYVGATLVGCLAAGALGMLVARAVWSSAG